MVFVSDLQHRGTEIDTTFKTGHVLSEESETGCRSLYKPSFIRKRGTRYLPQDLLMNEPLSFPLSLVWCVWMCVLRELH